MTIPKTSGAATAAPTIRKKRPNSQSRLMQQMGVYWNALSTDDKQTWKSLSGQLNPTFGVGIRSKTGAYALFTQHAIALLNAGSLAPTTAPAAPVSPPSFPPIRVDTAFAAEGFSLKLYADDVYSARVVLYAAPPVLAGGNIFPDKAFKKIGSLANISPGPVDITQMYASKYRMPGSGYEVALKLVGVTSGGFRTDGLVLTGVVLSAAEAAALADGQDAPGDLTLQKAA